MAYLDLSDLGLRTGDHHERTYALDLAPIVLGGSEYEVLLPDGVFVVVDRVAGGFLVTLSADAQVYGPCARCLGEVKTVVRAEQQEFAPTARDGWEGSELSDFINEFVVDVAGLAREAVILALPAQVVCSAECRGLCPQCGRDLNLGECDCAPQDTDGRWAKLKDLHLDDSTGP